MSFEKSLALTLSFEGTPDNHYVNDPDDAGGATKWGITQRTYDAWRRKKGRPLQAVKDMPDDERDCIYLWRYWVKASCNKLEDMDRSRLAMVHFDAAVHSGPHRAAKLLQVAVNATADGIIGPKTLAAVASTSEDTAVAQYLTARRGFLQYLAVIRPANKKFLRGWLRRVATLEAATGKE